MNVAALTRLWRCHIMLDMRRFGGSLILLLLLPAISHGQAAPSVLLSQPRLLFTAAAGSGSVPSQSVAVINVGGGTLNWTATAGTQLGGTWLSASPASGSSLAGAASPPQINVQVNATGLAPGAYDGSITVDAAGVANSPFFVNVSLTVLPPGSNPGVLVRPTGLVFVQSTSGSAPAAEPVLLTSTASASLAAVANPSTFAGGSWLTTTNSVTLSPGTPQNLSVQPSTTATLAPGQYFGVVSLLFADQTSATVNVLLLVIPPAAASCKPQKLLLADAVGSNFGVFANNGAILQTNVTDDCGNAITNASVSASFSNGNPPLQLTNAGNGLYSATWNVAGAAGPVTITLQATQSGLASAQVQRAGQILASGSTQINSAGIVNGASFSKRAVAPGEIISIFGQNLNGGGSGVVFASSFPIPSTLGRISILAGNAPVPLFFGTSSQINAQLPVELVPGSTVQVVARITSATGPDVVSLPVTLNIGQSDPGIFTIFSNGQGQGAIQNGTDGTLAAPAGSVPGAHPATSGEVVVIYCTGLGLTNPLVLSGQQVPKQPPLATVVNPVQVTIGGVQGSVVFAGLAPGFAGLYQLNVQIPQGVLPGSAVPLVVTQSGVSSNTVTIAVQ